MKKLKIPNDKEISAMLGDTPVASFHPDDFPHWDAAKIGQLTGSKLTERGDAMKRAYGDFYPAILDLKQLPEIIQNNAQNTTAYLLIMREDKVTSAMFFAP